MSAPDWRRELSTPKKGAEWREHEAREWATKKSAVLRGRVVKRSSERFEYEKWTWRGREQTCRESLVLKSAARVRESELLLLRETVVVGVGAFCLRSFVSLWGLRGKRARGRALDREQGKDGGRASGVEDVPRASPWVPRRHVQPGPREPADLQGSRDSIISFYLGIECVWCVRPRPVK